MSRMPDNPSNFIMVGQGGPPRPETMVTSQSKLVAAQGQGRFFANLLNRLHPAMAIRLSLSCRVQA